jgi:hypothetical protein
MGIEGGKERLGEGFEGRVGGGSKDAQTDAFWHIVRSIGSKEAEEEIK